MQKNFTAKRLIWKVMKTTTLYGMIILIWCGVAIAHPDHAQQILDREVTLNLHEVPLGQALLEIGSSANVKFVYSPSQLRLFEKVSIVANAKRLRDLLAELLTPFHVQYTVHEKESFITLRFQMKEDLGPGGRRSDEPLAHPAAFSVSGKVSDATHHEPLAGVNIIIKGTTKGTNTDAEGNYTIEADEKDVLIFSFIGFINFETAVGGRTLINVELQDDVTKLNEVSVNAGYWNVNEREQTGNISKITAAEIQKQPVSNPLQALQGRMAGVSIQQFTGLPGGNFAIQIRGLNSVRPDGNDPLYIVDGVPFSSTSLHQTSVLGASGASNPLNSINPSDIESIEVLKDADATSIYGSRGANGVVLITTKKGKAGKTKVDINFYQGVGNVSHYMKLLNTRQWLEMRHEAFKNDNAAMQSYDYDVNGTWDTTRYTNWQKELFGGTAHITNANASVSGGDANTQFIVGGGFYRETTVFPGSFAYLKGSGHFDINHTSPNNKLKISISSSYVADNNNLPTTDLTSVAISLPPDSPALRDKNGMLNWENSTWSNPLAVYLNLKYKSNTQNLVSRTTVSYEVIKGLQLKASMGYNNMFMQEIQTNPISANDPSLGITKGRATFADNNVRTWIIEPQAEYQREIGNGKFIALLGSTFQESVNQGKAIRATGFSNDELIEDIQAATTLKVNSVNQNQYRYNGFFGRLNYNWFGKYLINATGRRDGSSRFGPGNRFSNFGAVGAAWIFSKESFLSNSLSFISFGKLRASYGTTGSDQIGNYGYMDTYSTTQFAYQGVAGLIPTRLANSTYAWEKNTKIEAGLDLSFFSDRVAVSASWYRNRSSNQLVGYSLPVITGQSSILANLPAVVQNTGWEFMVSSSNVDSKNFKWTTSVNLTIPRNKLLAYPNLAGSSYANTYTIGQSLFTQKRFHSTGVDPQTGIYSFQDVDGNGSGNDYPADLLTRKSISQNFYGGVQNSFSYKGWKLDFFFQFVSQTGRSYIASFNNPPGSQGNNQPDIVMNRWRNPGDVSSIQKFTQVYDTGFIAYLTTANYGDNTIVDASFVRLKNVSLSWQLPVELTKKIKMQNCRVFIQGQNIYTFTNYLGFNPENQNSTVLPPLRVMTVGTNITF